MFDNGYGAELSINEEGIVPEKAGTLERDAEVPIAEVV